VGVLPFPEVVLSCRAEVLQLFMLDRSAEPHSPWGRARAPAADAWTVGCGSCVRLLSSFLLEKCWSKQEPEPVGFIKAYPAMNGVLSPCCSL